MDTPTVHQRVGGAPAVQVGEVIGVGYRVDRILGADGDGAVLLTSRLSDGRRAVLRISRGGAPSGEPDANPLARAFHLRKRLDSDLVEEALDLGSVGETHQYLATEYLDGPNLKRLVREKGPLPMKRAVDVALMICEALAAMHAAGIAHLALRPSTVFVLGDGVYTSIKLTGLTSALVVRTVQTRSETTRRRRDRSNDVFYVAPEQTPIAARVSERTDIWAVGRLLEFAMTGKAPGMVDHLTVTGGLRRVVTRCQARRKGDRFDNIAELAAALVPFGGAGAEAAADRARQALKKSARVSTPTAVGQRKSQRGTVIMADKPGPAKAGASEAAGRADTEKTKVSMKRKPSVRTDEPVVLPMTPMFNRRRAAFALGIVLIGALIYLFMFKRPVAQPTEFAEGETTRGEVAVSDPPAHAPEIERSAAGELASPDHDPVEPEAPKGSAQLGRLPSTQSSGAESDVLSAAAPTSTSDNLPRTGAVAVDDDLFSDRK